MSEHDGSASGGPRGDADQTLLGVAPPPLDSSAESPLRSPVFVRSGTSVTDVEPPPVPRMALPSRPPHSAADSDAAVQLAATPNRAMPAAGQLEGTRRFLGRHPALWMLLAPALIAVSAVALLRATAFHDGSKLGQPALRPGSSVERAPAIRAETNADALSKLQARPAQSLNAREHALLANAHSDELRGSAKALREKVEANPALGKDPALQRELLRLADDARTSADALGGMAAIDAPIGADLLYEVWTRTPMRSDATELARALVYSADLRPKVSPALAVALELRVAESCEQYKNILPRALKDGDRRSSQLLGKLSGKHGCGSKKRDDCYACLREQADELKATISAVKSRRAPDYSLP